MKILTLIYVTVAFALAVSLGENYLQSMENGAKDKDIASLREYQINLGKVNFLLSRQNKSLEAEHEEIQNHFDQYEEAFANIRQSESILRIGLNVASREVLRLKPIADKSEAVEKENRALHAILRTLNGAPADGPIVVTTLEGRHGDKVVTK